MYVLSLVWIIIKMLTISGLMSFSPYNCSTTGIGLVNLLDVLSAHSTGSLNIDPALLGAI
jgi:hypothetical protein